MVGRIVATGLWSAVWALVLFMAALAVMAPSG